MPAAYLISRTWSELEGIAKMRPPSLIPRRHCEFESGLPVGRVSTVRTAGPLGVITPPVDCCVKVVAPASTSRCVSTPPLVYTTWALAPSGRTWRPSSRYRSWPSGSSGLGYSVVTVRALGRVDFRAAVPDCRLLLSRPMLADARMPAPAATSAGCGSHVVLRKAPLKRIEIWFLLVSMTTLLSRTIWGWSTGSAWRAWRPRPDWSYHTLT